jgi:hypothetical protein
MTLYGNSDKQSFLISLPRQEADRYRDQADGNIYGDEDGHGLSL